MDQDRCAIVTRKFLRCKNLCNNQIGDGSMCTKHYLSSKGPMAEAKRMCLIGFQRAQMILRLNQPNIDVLREELVRLRFQYNHEMEAIHWDPLLQWDDGKFQQIRAYELQLKINGVKDPLVRYLRAKERGDAEDAIAGNRRPVIEPVVEPRGELQVLALDRQNVHTKLVVEETLRTTKIIREAVYVPEGYRWNSTEFSATPYAVATACQLHPSVSVHLLAIYSSDVAIYDIEEGIYGKVLDSVWQYIKQSPHKSDLCRILEDEIVDSVGMCAQGNLSRICNVLSGYLDGIKIKESTSEILGRTFPLLMDISEKRERLEKAKALLTEYNIPQEEWAAWIEPLE